MVCLHIRHAPGMEGQLQLHLGTWHATPLPIAIKNPLCLAFSHTRDNDNRATGLEAHSFYIIAMSQGLVATLH